MSAAILPLATTYNICEGLGVESGISKRFSEAPVFYWLYTTLIVFGAGVVLIPHLPLIRLILVSQVANGVIAAVRRFYMLKLVNRPDVMGQQLQLPLRECGRHDNEPGDGSADWDNAMRTDVPGLLGAGRPAMRPWWARLPTRRPLALRVDSTPAAT